MLNDCEEEIDILAKKKNEKKKILQESLKYLTEIEHKEIFKIVKKNDIKFSENSNGIFINVNKLDEKNLNEILLFIFFCKNNKKILKKNNILRGKLKDLVNKDKNKIKKPEKIIESNYTNEFKKGISYQDNKKFNSSFEFQSLNFKNNLDENYEYNELETIILNDLKYKN